MLLAYVLFVFVRYIVEPLFRAMHAVEGYDLTRYLACVRDCMRAYFCVIVMVAVHDGSGCSFVMLQPQGGFMGAANPHAHSLIYVLLPRLLHGYSVMTCMHTVHQSYRTDGEEYCTVGEAQGGGSAAASAGCFRGRW